MESIFEEKPEISPVRGGWKLPTQNNDLLQSLLSGSSLLEKHQHDSFIYERTNVNALDKVYAFITNEVFYIVKGKNNQDILKWINLKFRRMEKIYESNQVGLAIYGDRQKIEIFFTSEKSFKTWYSFFAEYCIQVEIEQYYDQQSQIGEGNYAKVYLGKEKETGKVVAIKQISKTLLRESSRNVTALVNEIESMRNVHQQYICGLQGMFENKNFIFLILEYCQGGELFTRIVKRRKFTEYNAARLAQNMLKALVYLHEEANVAHRDIKPENILMMNNDNDYDCKLADFGLAQKFDPVRKELSLRCGSPGYVAPEILRTNTYGPKCDVFSLGIVIYILLVGRQPFYGKNPQEVLLQNKECNINFQAKHWQEISKEALHFVVTLVDPDVSARPTAREALNHNWFKTNFPGMTNLVPANEIATPTLKKIEPLSAGLTASSKNIPREKINGALKNQEHETKQIWQDAVSSPVPNRAESPARKSFQPASNPTTPEKRKKEAVIEKITMASSLSTTPKGQKKILGVNKQSTYSSSNSPTSKKSSEEEEEKEDSNRRSFHEYRSSSLRKNESNRSQLSSAGKMVMAQSPQRKSGLSKQVNKTKLSTNTKANAKAQQEAILNQQAEENSPNSSPLIKQPRTTKKKPSITPVFIK